MSTRRQFPMSLLALVMGLATTSCTLNIVHDSGTPPDPLPSWNDGQVKSDIVEFVSDVTDLESEHFVRPAERIAVFDNDGTLWSEQPMYFQLIFVKDRIMQLAPDHPEWQENPVFRAVFDNDMAALASHGQKGIMQLLTATHAGMTATEFSQIAREWLSTAHHPRFDRPYTQVIYQPMLELLDYLRHNGFKTWIVSGGGIEFMRPWTEGVYGIPPEQVVGSSVATHFEMREDGPVIIREPKIGFIDDKEGKPVGIQRHIGRRPIAAFGNSDGDLQMLQWTAAGDGRRLMMFIHHTDAEREWSYDRDSHIGRLDKGLDQARRDGWLVTDMARDWKVIYPFELNE